jgi:hypothetical protein
MSDNGSWSVTLQETRNILGRLGFVAPNFCRKTNRYPFLKTNVHLFCPIFMKLINLKLGSQLTLRLFHRAFT